MKPEKKRGLFLYLFNDYIYTYFYLICGQPQKSIWLRRIILSGVTPLFLIIDSWWREK